MNDIIVLCHFAEESPSNSDSKETVFECQGKCWCLLECFSGFIEKCLEFAQYASVTSPFVLKEITKEDDEKSILAICYITKYKFKQQILLHGMHEYFPIIFKNYKTVANLNLNELIYNNEDEVEDEKSLENNEVDSGNKILQKYVTSKLYEDLYIKHLETTENNEKLQLPENFCPTLCRYQERAVVWLLQRERVVQRLPHYYLKLEPRDEISRSVYLHMFHFDLQTETPPAIELAPGGILSDEMGMGKTVEMLALILINDRKEMCNPMLENIIPNKRKCHSSEFLCFCTKKQNKDVVQCMICLSYQHKKCVTFDNLAHTDNINEPHYCSECWHQITKETLITTKATLIITPFEIRAQWVSEIRKHIEPCLKLFVYKGNIDDRSWISPRQLGDYDVVITDYNVLRRDFYHTDENMSDRKTRNEKKFLRFYTPLLMIEWWRICVDEAQMVESNFSMVARLVSKIAAINRWAVTGTPIQRSIDDLRSLLLFIGFNEVCEPNTIWNSLVTDFVTHHEIPGRQLMLVDILQKCMWRTCKSKVQDELKIPPQTERVHYIQLNDFEKLFYYDQHKSCSEEFYRNFSKYLSNKNNITSISPQLMKIVLQPLLKIRQCCVTPIIKKSLIRERAFHRQEQFLSPKELSDHMKTTNECECKTELRSMASSYNGMAAIFFLQQNYAEAINHYQRVLKLADEYESFNNISVDSLLQIHALHNMVEAHNFVKDVSILLDDDAIKECKAKSHVLEWKYLQTYASTLAAAKTSYDTVLNKLKSLESNKEQDLMQFLCECADELKSISSQDSLLQKIKDDCVSIFSGYLQVNESRNLNQILFMINTWHQKVSLAVKQLKRDFNKLEYFIDHVRSRDDIPTNIWQQMYELIRNVSECHLDVTEKKKPKTPSKDQKDKNLCQLCLIREKIDKLKSLLFHMYGGEGNLVMEQNDCSKIEVFICKTIFSFIRSKLSSLNNKCDFFWEYIETTQNFSKKLSKLWIEVEYTVKAYDELDMCKMRMSLAENEEDVALYSIMSYQLEETFTQQVSKLQEAERNFVKKLARLKYILHLEKKPDPGPCPICHTTEDDRYAIFECGHRLCLPCFKTYVKSLATRKFSCVVCRNVPNSQETFFVWRKNNDQFNNEIKGQYSSKIKYIVKLILELQNEADLHEIKILIFSQWQQILTILSAALKQNNIKHLIHRTPDAISAFKNKELSITCLLMPLAKGSKGLNLTEATHVFLVEPILNPADELQAIGRVHRIGQTRPTTVHRFIVQNTIEENIFNTVNAGKKSDSQWEFKNISTECLKSLFHLKDDIRSVDSNISPENSMSEDLTETFME